MKIKNRQKNKSGFTPTPNFRRKGNLVWGFTLIELMVATSIFIIIMLASMSSLFVMLDATKSSKALRFAMDNVNFAMESMTRSIRMGTNYYCVDAGYTMSTDIYATRDCSGETLLSFIPQVSATRIGYRIADVAGSNYHTIEKCNASGNCVPIVSPLVNIERLKFFVSGSSRTDEIQASVYIIIKGTVIVKGIPTSFAIQTMASQRNF